MGAVNLTAQMRDKLDIKKHGVLIKSVGDGIAFKAGLRAGDVVMQFAGIDINNTKHFKELVDDMDDDKYFSVLINRQGNPIFLALKK
jgi:serine protease Do